MDNREDLSGSPVVLTGANAQELVIGAGRCQQGGHRRDPGGPPRPPQRGERPLGEGTDPFAQGFKRIMTRFDQLEVRMDSSDRRVGNLENPPIRVSDQQDDDYDSDDADYVAYRDTHPRQHQLGFRNRRSGRRGRREAYASRDDFCRDEDWQQDSDPDTKFAVDRQRRRSS